MSKKLKIGLIARCDNGGLGRLSQDFYENLPIHRVMALTVRDRENHLDRFPGAINPEKGVPSLEEIDAFLEGLDMVLTFETPYNWNIFSRAKERGIKTVLIPNYEWTPYKLTVDPDLLLCPSQFDYDELKGMGIDIEYLPIPIDRKKLPFKLRKKAKTFIFNNGHGGYLGRNSYVELTQAIPLVKADVKFIIRSQIYPPDMINDSRVEYQLGDTLHENLWKEGDVFIHPHKFDGLSLPLNEAMSSGYPIITTDMAPYNGILPKELLIEPDAFGETKIERTIKYAVISPLKIAEKIEYIANKDITELSNKSNELAELWSWNNLKDKYLELFTKLCQNQH